MAHGLCVVSDFASCFSPSFLALAQTYIFLSSELKTVSRLDQVLSFKLKTFPSLNFGPGSICFTFQLPDSIRFTSFETGLQQVFLFIGFYVTEF